MVALPVEKQEYLIENEFKSIKLSEFSMLIKTHYDKKMFSRSRNDIYEYPSDFTLLQVSEICLSELKKNQWIILRTKKINDCKYIYVLQKNNLYALLNFEEPNFFSLQIGYITLENKINKFP